MTDKAIIHDHARTAGTLLALLLGLMLILIGPREARAEVEFEWAGFGTIGAGVLDDDSINQRNPIPHNNYEEDVKFDVDSRLGFQGTWFFDESFSATLQIVSDSADDDDVDLEWAYLSYDINRKTKLRVGRLRRPLYANSDFLPVGYVYPWARPPLEVYSRDIQLYDGVDAIDLLYQSKLGDWDVTTEVYYGGSSGTTEVAPGEEGDYETNNDFGLVFEFEKDWLGLRLGYHRSPDVTVESVDNLEMLYANLDMAGFGSIADEMETSGIEGEFYNLGLSIDYEDWLLLAEYVKVPVDEGLVPEETSWYLTAGRRMGPWTFHLTYGDRDRESKQNFSQPILDQAAIIGAPFNAPLLALAGGVDQAVDALKVELHSYTLGVRYDFDQPVSIKAEYQYIEDEQFDLTNNLVSVVVDFLF